MSSIEYVIYDKATGAIQSRCRSAAESIDLNIASVGDSDFYLNCPDDATHIIDNEPVILEMELSRLKIKRRIEIISARNLAEQLPFEYLGKLFDADEKSIKRLTLATQAAQSAILAGQSFSLTWTCADNSTIDFTEQQLLGVLGAMMLRGIELHEKARALKIQIDAAESAADIDAIVW